MSFQHSLPQLLEELEAFAGTYKVDRVDVSYDRGAFTVSVMIGDNQLIGCGRTAEEITEMFVRSLKNRTTAMVAEAKLLECERTAIDKKLDSFENSKNIIKRLSENHLETLARQAE